MNTQLKDGQFYWVNAPAIDDLEPIMIGQYYIVPNIGRAFEYKWYINGQRYTAGQGIDAIRHIPKPRQ